MSQFLENIGQAILTIAIGVSSSWFGYTPPAPVPNAPADVVVAATQVVADYHSSLVSPISAAATTITVVSTSTDSGENLIQGRVYGLKIGGREYVLGTLSSGRQFTSVTRGISTITGTTTGGINAAWGRGASVEITDAPILLDLSNKASGTGTFDQPLLFDQVATYTSAPSFTTQSNQLASVKYAQDYANAVIAGGAATSTELLGGKVELATQLEMASSTAIDVDKPRALWARYSTSSPYTMGNWIPITNARGVLSPLFIATSSIDAPLGYDYTASSTHRTSTTTFNGGLSIAASPTIPTYFRSIPYIFPSTQGASSTVHANNGSGTYTNNTIDQLLKTGDRLIIATTTSFTLVSSNSETTYAAGDTYTVPAGALGTNGVLRISMTVSDFDQVDGDSGDGGLAIRLKLGGTEIGSLNIQTQGASGENVDNDQGKIEFTVANKDSESAQIVQGALNISPPSGRLVGVGNLGAYAAISSGTATINTAASQQLTITFDWVDSSAENSITINSLIATIE